MGGAAAAADAGSRKRRRPANPPFWYSFDYGAVHFVMVSSEHDLHKHSVQYKVRLLKLCLNLLTVRLLLLCMLIGRKPDARCPQPFMGATCWHTGGFLVSSCLHLPHDMHTSCCMLWCASQVPAPPCSG